MNLKVLAKIEQLWYSNRVDIILFQNVLIFEYIVITGLFRKE